MFCAMSMFADVAVTPHSVWRAKLFVAKGMTNSAHNARFLSPEQIPVACANAAGARAKVSRMLLASVLKKVMANT